MIYCIFNTDFFEFFNRKIYVFLTLKFVNSVVSIKHAVKKSKFFVLKTSKNFVLKKFRVKKSKNFVLTKLKKKQIV